MNDRLLEILEERSLAFIVPSLSLARDLSSAIQHVRSSSPSSLPCCDDNSDEAVAVALANCITDHVTAEDKQTPEFIHALMPSVYGYIYQCGHVELGIEASVNALMTRELLAWRSLAKTLLADLFREKPSRQMDALHALQLFWKSKSMPKGMSPRNV